MESVREKKIIQLCCGGLFSLLLNALGFGLFIIIVRYLDYYVNNIIDSVNFVWLFKSIVIILPALVCGFMVIMKRHKLNMFYLFLGGFIMQILLFIIVWPKFGGM